MRAIVLPAIIAIALLATSSAAAQTGQPHVTVTVTGPTYVYPRHEATFDVVIDVDGPESDVYLTWSGAGSPIGPGGLCCEYLRSPVQFGTANVVGSQVGSIRLSVRGPRAVLQLVLELYDQQATPQIAIGAYLPGSNVSQYLTVTGFKSIVGSGLPITGGPLASDSRAASGLTFAGLAMLALSGTCFVAGFARRRRA